MRWAASARGFVGHCRLALIVGAAIRLLIAPFTSTNIDMAVWATSVRHAIAGVPLYSKPGFSYPPVWGYLLHAGGLVARLVGAQPQSVATSPVRWWVLAARDWQLSPYVTTPLATFFIKLPLICSDLLVAWLIWHIVLSLGFDSKKAKTAVVLWLFNPLVIFASSVHGAFDTLVALTIAAALLARLRRHYFLAGAAVAIGVLTKLTPAFIVPLLLASCLWPMGNEEEADRGRAFRLIVAGGAVALLVGLAPLAASGTLHDAYTNVFARASASSSVGGLSWLGFGSLPAFSSVTMWALQPGNPLVDATVLFDLVPAAGAVYLWHRSRRDGAVLVALAMFVMVLVVVIGPLANPQYLLWVLPALVILAAFDRRLLVVCWLLGAAGVVFELAVVSPLAFLSPSSLAFGVPSVRSIVTAPFSMATSTIFGVPVDRFFEFAAFVITMLAVLLAISALRKYFVRAASRSHVVPARVGSTGLRILGAGMLGGSILAGLLPATFEASATPVTVEVHVRNASSHSIDVSWNTDTSQFHGAAITALTTPTPQPLRAVDIYADPSYPTSGSSAFDVQGVVVHLPVDLATAGVHTEPRVVNAVQLASILSDTAGAAGVVVVDAAGTLPNTVWGKGVDAVTPFLEAGGTLVWGGDEPGYYSVGRAPSMDVSPPPEGTPNDRCGPVSMAAGPPLSKAVAVMGESGVTRILGWPGLLPTSWSWGCTATTPSPVATALGLSSIAVHGGPRLTTLKRIHGADLGYGVLGRTSISWIPQGKGGVLLFSGSVDPTSFSSDTATLLASAGARPDISVVARFANATAGVATIPAPRGACRVRVTLVVIDQSASVFVDRHTGVNLCATSAKAAYEAVMKSDGYRLNEDVNGSRGRRADTSKDTQRRVGPRA